MDCSPDCLGHFRKQRNTRCLFSVDRSITGQRSPVFFGTRNSLLKKPGKWLLWTGSMSPFSNMLSTAFCRSCFLFLVGKWMGVLVKGGWWHSHFNRIPDRRILHDLHSPSRFCHCWAKTARRAPTNTPFIVGPPLDGLVGTTTPSPSAGVPGEWTSCDACVGEVVAVSRLVLLSVLKGLVTSFLSNWWS